MLDKTRHEIIMKNILKDVYSDRTLAPILGFKGGTAAYFFYGLPRFSVDLDFDLLAPEMAKKVFEKMGSILSRYGDLTQALEKRNTIFFLTYEKNKQKIKIEISEREKTDSYEIKNFLGISVLTMVKKDMFANKLAAGTERKMTAMRDFFDINYFLQKAWDINEEIIERRTGKNLRNYLEFMHDFVEKNLSKANILDGLGAVLSEGQKDSVKETLKRDLLFGLKNYLSVK
jgi:predicted nucleotidyltransferase component of viral defense system